jgi:hypothetical protein
VTTLSSHFHARKNMAQCVKERPKLLAVSQPETPEQQHLPLSTKEVNTVVQMAFSAGWPAEDIIHLNGSDAAVISLVLASNGQDPMAGQSPQDP